MIVCRHLVFYERVKLLAAFLSLDKTLTLMDWHPAAKIWQAEGGLAIAAVGSAKEREERLVLVDRQELPVTECPAPGSEVPGYDFYFGEIRLSHIFLGGLSEEGAMRGEEGVESFWGGG